MQRKLKIAGVVVFLLVILLVTVIFTRWALSLSEASRLEEFQSRVASLGFGGWLLLFAIQYMQIVVAFIPGGPIQIVAGALFGFWGGLAIFTGGTLLATATIFFLVSRLGRPVIALFVEEKDFLKYNFLTDDKNLEKLVLLLYFVPGTPKDALTYIFALTKIKMSRFMFLSMLARTPAALTSLLAGGSIIEGNLLRAGIMFVIMSAVSIAGLFLQRALQKRIITRRKKEK